MDALRGLLEELRRHGLERGHMLGLSHLLIGRRILRADGSPVSQGLSWRSLAALFKKVRWDKEGVRELGLDPKSLPPRDRQQYWYVAISKAAVDSPEAERAGAALTALLEPLGYRVGS